MSFQNDPIEAEIKRAIQTKINLDPDTIVRTGKDLSFEDIKGEVLILFRLLKMLLPADLKLLPEENLQKLNNAIKSMMSNIENMQNFDVRSDTPERNRHGIQTTFNQTYNHLLPFLLDSLYFINLTKEDVSVEKIAHEIQEAMSDVQQHTNNFKNLVANYTAVVNQSAQEYGMRNYAKIFSDESTAFAASAKKWFTASIWVLTGSVIIATILLFVNKEYMDRLDIIQFTITKVLILTVLFYAVTICFKNYKAQKHNEILNKHRSNALLTFEAFTGSKEDPQTKAAVLLAATQTIFGNQQTGYGNTDSSDSDLPSKIIEIIKTPSTK